jgi:hypothetical protein
MTGAGIFLGPVCIHNSPSMTNETPEFLYLIGPFSLLLQVLLCVHAYKTGRPYWWIWILLAGSLVGCLVYLLIEVLPDAKRNSPRLIRTSWFVPRSLRLRRARAVVEDSPTVETKLALAALLSDFGHAQEAEEVASECVSGVFKDDPMVISEVVWYKLATGKTIEAERLLAQANMKHNKTAQQSCDLLQARIHLAQGNLAQARQKLEPLVNASLGDEPRYHLAQCLLKMDDHEGARSLLIGITTKYRKAGKIWRRAERKWYLAAKHTLDEMAKADSRQGTGRS